MHAFPSTWRMRQKDLEFHGRHREEGTAVGGRMTSEESKGGIVLKEGVVPGKGG